VSNFDDVKEVKITLKIASKALYYMAYSTYQEWLFSIKRPFNWNDF